MIQFFAKNFFSKIFPVKYFQRKTETPTPPIPVKTPTSFFQSGGFLSDDVSIKITGCVIQIYVSPVIVKTEIIYDTEEEIIELIKILFLYFDNSFTNNSIDDKQYEEELLHILTALEWL